MTPDMAAVFLGMFAGRTDAYQDFPTGAEHWLPRREPLTPAVVVDHWQRRVPLGFYFLAGDRTHVAAIDFDRDDGVEVACRLGAEAWRLCIPAYVERSRRGAHLWIVADERLPALVLRSALRALLRDAGLPLDDPKIELRPGSDHVPPDGLGHALRAPMFSHPATGERHALADPRTRQPLGTSLASILLAFEQAPADAFAMAAERWKPIVDPRTIPSSYRRPRVRDDDGPTVVELLGQTGITAVPGRAVKCPFHDDRHPSLSVARDERRVFCKSPTCEAHNAGRGLGSNQLAALIARARVA